MEYVKRAVSKVAVVVGSNGAVGKKASERFSNIGYDVIGVTRNTDITQIKSCDVLICTAGKTNREPMTTDNFSKMLDYNLVTLYDTVQKFKQKLTDNSVIVIVSSVSAYKGGSNIGYAAAKAGTESLCKNLALEFAPRTRVMSVAPSYIVDSDFVKYNQQSLDSMKNFIPLKRLCTTDDVASAIEACVTHLKFSTGSTIFVDGGRLL
jgi:3-oxoacyl-[acyl-carrier protein] reductase